MMNDETMRALVQEIHALCADRALTDQERLDVLEQALLTTASAIVEQAWQERTRTVRALGWAALAQLGRVSGEQLASLDTMVTLARQPPLVPGQYQYPRTSE